MTEFKRIEERFFLPDTMCPARWADDPEECRGFAVRGEGTPRNLIQCLGIVGFCQGYFCGDCPPGLLGKYLLTDWLMAC